MNRTVLINLLTSRGFSSDLEIIQTPAVITRTPHRFTKLGPAEYLDGPLIPFFQFDRRDSQDGDWARRGSDAAGELASVRCRPIAQPLSAIGFGVAEIRTLLDRYQT